MKLHVAEARIAHITSGKELPGPFGHRGRGSAGQGKVYLLTDHTVLRSCDIGLGNQPVGRKQFKRDGPKPHGLCLLDRFTSRSRHHPSTEISYRSRRDKADAAESWRGAGGDIMAHGDGSEGRFFRQETAF